jgi:hypothetical protein
MTGYGDLLDQSCLNWESRPMGHPHDITPFLLPPTTWPQLSTILKARSIVAHLFSLYISLGNILVHFTSPFPHLHLHRIYPFHPQDFQ